MTQRSGARKSLLLNQSLMAYRCSSVDLPLWLAGTPLLPRERVFAGRVARFQRGYFAVLHDELIDHVRELRGSELEALNGKQLDGRSSRECQRETGAGLVEHFKFNLGRSHVSARELFEQGRIKRLGLAREDDFSLIQRNHRVINVSLRVRPEVNGELAVLLIVGRVKTVVMKVAHRKLEFVKSELQRVVLEPDLENA